MANQSQTPNQRVLWMDPRFQAHRPTTQSLYQALPVLVDLGWDVELWCLDHDAVDERVRVVKFPRASWLRLLEPLWFWALAWWRLVWKRLAGNHWDIVHSSGPDIPGVDVMSLHFHNRTWIPLQWQEKSRSWKERLKILHTVIGVVQETLAFKASRWRLILPVSEGLASRIRPNLRADKTIQVLPNVLDEKRFNSEVRGHWRESVREAMKMTENDYVLSFVSTGHYQRKGLWAAVEALQGCRAWALCECGLNLQFWVIGVNEHATVAMRSRLNEIAPDSEEWVHLIPPTQEVERWYAAADAFLFPSRYETFSLVALEASACGLPLLITPYDGHEMYFQDGVNGCLLPWDVEGMIQRIQRYLKVERFQMQLGPIASLSVRGYAEALHDAYQKLVESKPTR